MPYQAAKNRLEKENRGLKEKLAGLRNENRLLQKGLKESRKLLNDMPGATVLIQQKKVVFINEAARKRLGYTEEEIGELDLMELVHPDCVERIRILHQRRISGKSVPDQYETRLITKHGEALSCEIRVKKIRFQGRMAFLLNVTGLDQRKQMEMQLRHSQKMEALSRMASSIGREFKGFSKTLNECALGFQDTESVRDAKLVPWFATIEAAREKANFISDQLHCLTKAENECSDIILLDLSKIVQDAVAITSPRWKEDPERRGVKINLNSYLRNLSPIEGHSKEIRDVFVNMLLNAVDAVQDGGEIYLTIEEDYGFAYAYIQDNGAGIPGDIKDKIFDPFFTTKGSSRLGLGLSMAHAVINRHGGNIEVMSQEGQGATFIIKLPLAPKTPSPKTGYAKKNLKNSHILIIADEGIVKDLLAQLLVSKGCRVTGVSTHTEAIRIFGKHKIDFVIADLNMPYLESLRILKKIKEMEPTLPIALVNAEENGESVHALEKLGADIVLGRPLEVGKIISFFCEASGMKEPSG